MQSSEHKIINGKNKLIVCFGGMALLFGGILPFEFLNYLSSIYTNEYDLIFYIDKHQCWYHKGIDNITTNIEETVLYLNNIIKDGNYNKVIFMGTSAGGYAAILFGSLCDNVNNVISFKPQTILENPTNVKYRDLRNIINETTNYILYGNKSIYCRNDLHHILHCENIEHFPNVKVIKSDTCDLKQLRDNGFIKQLIDNLI